MDKPKVDINDNEDISQNETDVSNQYKKAL